MKRRHLLPTLFAALLVCGCSALLAPKWETLSEGGFTAQVPGKAEKQTQSVSTAVGPVTFNTFSVEHRSEAFIVGYNDFPAAALANVDAEQLLNNAKTGAVQNVGGKVTGEKSITMAGHPGKEFVGEGVSPGTDSSGKKQEATFTARIYWAKPRLYQVLYIHPKGSAASETGQKFLDSFQIAGK
ncbi:MAG: hypothetical protein H7Z38_09315 [Rubrivivax sp.]|nr:hypothetical protein [Pyrinomonadaceae bacterium]